MKHKLMIPLVLLICCFACPASGGNVILSLCNTELELLSDSTIASSWGAYGLSLLHNGDPLADHAFQTCNYLGDSPEGLRGKASLQVQSGNVDTALEILSADSSDVFVRIMQCCISQNGGIAENSIELFEHTRADSLPEGASDLLLIRQLRLSQHNLSADSIAGTLGDLCNPFADIALLDYFLNGAPSVEVDSARVLRGLRADAILTGSVYFNQMISVARTDGTPPLFAAEIMCIAGRRDEADQILSSIPPSEQGIDEQIMHADLLLAMGELSRAESVLEVGREQHPDSRRILAILGHVQLKGGKYREAYSLMEAAVEQTGSPECMAIMGLSAELAGEFPLAVAAYSPLLDMSADSIVLVNRYRNSLFDQTMRAPCNPTTGTQWQNPGSGLRMNVSLSYYRTTGIYSQESISASSRLSYRYGLYSSRLSLSGNYSENSWQGASYRLKRLYSSFDVKNYSTSNLFETLEFGMEQSREETRRWKFEALAGCGYKIIIGSSVAITPSLAAGRIINKWDDELFQRDAWVYAPGLAITISNLLSGTINPTFTLRGNSSSDINDPEQYEIDTGASVSVAINRLLSLSFSYSTEYQSMVPPENNSELDTSSQASLNFHF